MSKWKDGEWILNFFEGQPDDYHVPLDALRACVNDAPTIDPKHGEWIPCSERLPEEGSDVNVTYKDGTVHAVYKCRPYLWGESNLVPIIAWMPLPEPWKGADNE